MASDQEQSAWDWDVFWPRLTETPQKQIRLWLIWWGFSIFLTLINLPDGMGPISSVAIGGSVFFAWIPPLVLLVKLKKCDAESKQ